MANSFNIDRSLVVAERNLDLGQAAFLRTDDGSQTMNINGLPSGAMLSVWDGTGASDSSADWTVTGDGGEQPAADAGGGTNGWDSGAVSSNSNTEFDNGAEIDIAGTYDALTFQLNPQAYPGNAQFQIQWKNAAGTVIGATLNVEDYTTNMDFGVVQQVQIPVADFGLTGDVQKLNFVYKVGNQQHYIDDINLQASGGGGPYIFQVSSPNTNTKYHVSMVVFLVSAPAAGWNPHTFADQAQLPNGVILRCRKQSTNEILWKFNSKDNTDLFGRYHPQDDIEFADGTLLVGFMVKPGMAAITVCSDIVLEFVIRDDLSGLTEARAFCHYGVEDITP